MLPAARSRRPRLYISQLAVTPQRAWPLVLFFALKIVSTSSGAVGQARVVDRSGSGADAYPWKLLPSSRPDVAVKPTQGRKTPMNDPIQLTNIIPLTRTSIVRSPLPGGFVLIALALTWFALSPQTQAVSPPPDGGYAGENTAEGDFALQSLTDGFANTAIGNSALNSNTTGNNNTATGSRALGGNITGGGNTATGVAALGLNTTGSNNTATGSGALFGCTGGECFSSTGNNNTATGVSALSSNTGDNNTATGLNALELNTTGGNNTAEGVQALQNSTGSNNIALGYQAGINLTSGSNNIHIGARGIAVESNTIRIGRTGAKAAYVQGISGATVASGVTVIVDTKGHLGTVQSSGRFKDEIKPMDNASEAILALQPVTFRYNQELDPDGIPQFGLVAEQVEKVNPDLVARDAEGKAYTVRYEAVNAMLLNEFLKEHRKVAQLEKMAAQQQKQIEALIQQAFGK
jgi:hypothetical protein